MPFNKNYNNNDKQPTINIYTPISFSNPESSLNASRLSISYFNKLMRVSIANRLGSSKEGFASYDNDNAAEVYVSFSKAKILSNMIDMLNGKEDVHNVCIELKNGLLKISDGSEFGSTVPCISISSADSAGNISETIYQCKPDYFGAYNYKNDNYHTKEFESFELDTIKMVLEEYYRASSYAIAMSVHESGMYRREGMYNVIKAIAEKVGASNSSGGKYNSKSFLSKNENDNQTSSIPKEYDSSTFDDVVREMSGT